MGASGSDTRNKNILCLFLGILKDFVFGRRSKSIDKLLVDLIQVVFISSIVLSFIALFSLEVIQGAGVTETDNAINYKDLILPMTAFSSLMVGCLVALGAYRSRKLEKKKQFQNLITTNRLEWLGKVREAMAELCAMERSYLQSRNKDDIKESRSVIILKLSTVILSLNPRSNKNLCCYIRDIAREICECVDNDGKSNDCLMDKIKSQEEMFQDELKVVWEDIKKEADEASQLDVDDK